MFRPPEYAALISPTIHTMINTSNVVISSEELADYLKRMSPCASRLGPKEWSPIGEYKLVYKKP